MTTDVAIHETLLELEHLSPLICVELAAGLSTVDGIQEKYKITKEQWLRLKENPTFVHMMKEAALTFTGDMNAGKRITKKAELLLEELLPTMFKLASAAEASTGTVVDIVKQLKEIAGIGGRYGGNQGGGVGPGFNVHIEIRTHDKGVTIQGN
jgi:hypothetical protein